MRRTESRMALLGAGLGLFSLAVILLSSWMTMFAGPTPWQFTDLNFYRAAIAKALAGQPWWDELPYPPITRLVIAPLGGLTVLEGNRIWTLISFAAGVGLGTLIAVRRLQSQDPRWRQSSANVVMWAALASTALFVDFPMVSQLENGQINLLVITLAFVDLAQLLPRRFRGCLVGAAAAVKLTPLIFIPYYLVTGQWREAARAMATFVGVGALAWLLFPNDSLVFWTHVGAMERFGDPGRLDGLSMSAVLARWLPDAAIRQGVWIALALLVTGAALYRARRHWYAGEAMESVLVMGAALVAVSPVAWPHYLVWITLAGIWMALSKRRLGRVLGLLLLVVSLPLAMEVLAFRAKTGLLPARILYESFAIIPVVIAVLGLPHRLAGEASGPKSTPGANSADRDQSEAGIVLAGN